MKLALQRCSATCIILLLWTPAVPTAAGIIPLCGGKPLGGFRLSDSDGAISLNADERDGFGDDYLAVPLGSGGPAAALRTRTEEMHAEAVQVMEREGPEAEAKFAEVLRCDPTHAKSYADLSSLALKQGSHDKAMQLAKRALELDAEMLVAAYNVGRIHATLQHYIEAAAAYTQVIEVAPQRSFLAFYALQELGSAQLALKQLDRAEATFRQLVRLQSRNPIANGQLSDTLHRQKRYHEAAEAVELAISRKAWETGEECSYLHMCAAKVHLALGDVAAACRHCREAVEAAGSKSGFAQVAVERCRRQAHDEEVARAAARRVEQAGQRGPLLHKIPRRYNLTFEAFFHEYAVRRRPVIISDALERMGSVASWKNLSHVAAVCGHRPAFLKEQVRGSSHWAGLEKVGEDNTTVGAFVRSLQAQELEQPLYLFDWGLPKYCPELLDGFIMPRYFAQDFLQRTPAKESDQYREQWPSLFIGPQGSGCNLHVDSIGSHFWMVLISGRKRWRIFAPNSSAFLEPNYLGGSFGVDAFAEVSQQPPQLDAATVWECDLQPGEAVFVPAGSPHQVQNLEHTVAISGNYIDASNFEQAKQELGTLAIAGEVASKANDLLSAFNALGFVHSMDMEVEDAPYQDFKNGVGARHA